MGFLVKNHCRGYLKIEKIKIFNKKSHFKLNYSEESLFRERWRDCMCPLPSHHQLWFVLLFRLCGQYRQRHAQVPWTDVLRYGCSFQETYPGPADRCPSLWCSLPETYPGLPLILHTVSFGLFYFLDCVGSIDRDMPRSRGQMSFVMDVVFKRHTQVPRTDVLRYGVVYQRHTQVYPWSCIPLVLACFTF